jgi:large subunit ribosomal protein L10
MSKPVKELITDQYRARFDGLPGGVLIDVRGIQANENNRMRAELAEKSIKVTVIKNSLARQAFKDTDLAPLSGMLKGANALVYPVDDEVSVVNVARELIDQAKKNPNLQFKGALLDGIEFGAEGIKALSEYPTKEEAQATIVTLMLSPARNLAGSLGSPASKIAGIIDAVREKLEAGEAITAN